MAAVAFHSLTVWARGVHCPISAEAWKARTKSITNRARAAVAGPSAVELARSSR
jgi:hypothetical protein